LQHKNSRIQITERQNHCAALQQNLRVSAGWVGVNPPDYVHWKPNGSLQIFPFSASQ
jgi:hypothetical protein